MTAIHRKGLSSKKTSVKSTAKSLPSKACPSEHWEQAQFYSWWRKTQPDIIFAIPNGGKRSKSQASKLSLEGVHPGVWDMFAPERGLWIEFKRQRGGYLSKEQKEFGVLMLTHYSCMVAYGWQDAVYQLENEIRPQWKNPLRAVCWGDVRALN